jgi:AcrR family transcriptional regulator
MPPAPLSPRKAPRQARAQATRDAILEAAAQILSARGLEGYNTNAVAARAGVSIGSLYQYFPNKDALMVALIARQQARQADHVAAVMAGAAEADLESAVRTIVRAGMQHHHDDSLLASAIDHEEARLPVGAILEEAMDRGGALLALFAARFPAELGTLDRQRAARTLPALIRTVVDSWSNLSPPQLDVAEEEAVRAVLGYLRCGSTAG